MLNGVYSGTAGAPLLEDVVAVAVPGTTTGSNLVAVWYHKTGANWATMSWSSTNPWSAISYVKAQLNISGSEDGNWSVAPFVVVGEEVAVAEQYNGGLLTSDPLYGIVTGTPNAPTIIQTLTSIGYASADLSVDAGVDCTVDATMESVAARFDNLITSGDSGVLTISSPLNCEAMAGIPMGDPPVLPAKPTTAPPWSPPGTDPTLPATPAWLPGPWKTTGTPPAPLYKCAIKQVFGGGTECECKRIRIWGRWETGSCWYGVCIKEHWIEETEKCTAPGPACAPDGPPATTATCDSTYN